MQQKQLGQLQHVVKKIFMMRLLRLLNKEMWWNNIKLRTGFPVQILLPRVVSFVSAAFVKQGNILFWIAFEISFVKLLANEREGLPFKGNTICIMSVVFGQST